MLPVLIALLATAAAGAALFEDHIVIPLPGQAAASRGYSGSIVELKDGSLLFACGNAGGTLPGGGIIGFRSADGGRTWGAPFRMQPNVARRETIAPSLLRLRDGRLLFAYNVLNNWEGADHRTYDGRVYVRWSSDEGRTWSDQFSVMHHPGFHTVQPQHVIQLATGRIVVPAEWSRQVGGGEAGHCVSLSYFSDDGQTWCRGNNYVDVGSTTEEPSVVELKDGRLMMVFRCLKGYVGKAYSTDRGDTWSPGEMTSLGAPMAPCTIHRVPTTGDLLLLWCNNPDAPGLHARGEKQETVAMGGLQRRLGDLRTPLTAAISHDEGTTWEHLRNIGDKPREDYGYQGVTFIEGGKVALVNYNALDGIHVTRIGVEWFYEK